MHFNESPEWALVLEASVLRGEHAGVNNLQQLCEAVTDWERVLTIAGHTGLGGLLYTRLTSVELPDDAFTHTRDSLHKQYRLFQFNNMRLLDGMDTLTTALDRVRVPHMPLKGIDLIGRLYQDPGLRPTSDIDLLIQNTHISTFTKAAEGSGFKRLYKHGWQGRAFKHHQVDGLVGHGINIDLHRRLQAYRHFPKTDMKAIWKASYPDAPGSYRHHMSNEHTLIHLMMHLFRHVYAEVGRQLKGTDDEVQTIKFIWFADIASFIFVHSKQINWPRLMEQSRLFESMHATSTILGTLLAYYPDLAPRLDQPTHEAIQQHAAQRPHYQAAMDQVFQLTATSTHPQLQPAAVLYEETEAGSETLLRRLYGLVR